MPRSSILVLAGVTLVALFSVLRIDKELCFFGDSVVKYVQARSLLEHGFQSEEYIYEGRSIDPDFSFFPFQGLYLVKIHGQYLGQYPIAFTALSALVLSTFSNGALYYISFIAFLLLVLLYQGAARPHWFLLASFALGTPLLGFSLDYSEQLPYALICSAAITGFLTSFRQDRIWMLFASGLLIGLATFLRLESLVLCLAIGLCSLLLGDVSWRNRFMSILPFATGAALGVAAFMVFNQIRYDLPLGPRMLANAGLFWQGAEQRAHQILTLLVAGKMQIGFAVYMPALVVMFVAACLARFRSQLSDAERVLHPGLIVFILIMSVAAPGDGALNWGPRYLILSIFPGFMLLSKLQKTVKLSRSLTITMVLLLALPVLLTVVGVNMRRSACKLQKRYITELKKHPDDVWVFVDPLLSHYQGPEFFGRMDFYVSDPAQFAAKVQPLKGRTISVFIPTVKQSWQADMKGYLRSEDAVAATWSRLLVHVETVDSDLLRVVRLRVP